MEIYLSEGFKSLSVIVRRLLSHINLVLSNPTDIFINKQKGGINGF